MKLRGLGHRGRGLRARHKLAAQFAVGALAGLALSTWAPTPAHGLPSPIVLAAGLPIVAAAWSALVVATFSNATNVTDGLDGLLAGLGAMAAGVLGIACWAAGAAESAVFCGAWLGACLGFLRFNRHPACVFMGDTGSLALGGGLAATALAAGHEVLLGVVGFVILAEFASSLLQIGWFKAFGRRILPCAPLHHTFQLRGDPEVRIVRGFYLCGAVTAFGALNLLWL
jgi:phospho-N-acetylmuramoyl-pentapeptide-transferase